MPRNARGADSEPPHDSRRSTTPEGRENELIALAYGLVEKRIREGTATSQEVTHFLKLGSSREQLEQQRLHYENQLTEAKIEALSQAADIKELYSAALLAMRQYSGQEPI